MDIKLRARLSAYSKIESLSGVNSNIPDPDATREGHILGVGNNGQYTLFGKVTTEDIDTRFNTVGANEVATHDEIDELFEKDNSVDAVSKDQIDTLFTKTDDKEAVSKEDIDSLFDKNSVTVESATKEEIDNLFNNTSEPNIGTVSYADIDSLFK